MPGGGQSFGQGRNRFGANTQAPSNNHFRFNGQRSSNQQGFPGGNRMNTGAGSNYTVPVVVYAIIFFLAILAVYFSLIRSNRLSKLKIDKGNQKLIILTLCMVGLLLRIALGILIEGHPFDLNLFKSWATSAANNLSQFYTGRNSSDYPPLYIYILFLIGKIESLKVMYPYFTILLKLPSILADIGTALLLFKLARKYLTSELSIFVAAFYIFNPAVFVNSTIWGQVDSFFTLLVVAGVVLLAEHKLVYSSIFFTAAVLMKPQGIIFLPVMFFELVRQKSLKSFFKVIISGVITALVIILPFSANLNILWIFKLFASTLGEYPYATVNAFNFFYLLGANYTKDSSILLLFSYHTWGMTFIVLITLIAWLAYVKGKGNFIASAAALILISGVFIFSTSMHERYLFPAVALAVLAAVYLQEKRFILLATGFSITAFINTFYILWQTNLGINRAAFDALPAATSILNLLLFGYLVKVIYGSIKTNSLKSA